MLQAFQLRQDIVIGVIQLIQRGCHKIAPITTNSLLTLRDRTILLCVLFSPFVQIFDPILLIVVDWIKPAVIDPHNCPLAIKQDHHLP